MKSRAGLKRVVKTVHTKHGAKKQTFWVRAGKTAARGAIVAAGAGLGAAAGHALGRKYGSRGHAAGVLRGAAFGGVGGAGAGASLLGALGGMVVGARAYRRDAQSERRFVGIIKNENIRRIAEGKTPLRETVDSSMPYARTHGMQAVSRNAPYGAKVGGALGGLFGGVRAHQQAAARTRQTGIYGGIAGGSIGALAGGALANRLVR